MYVTVFHLHRDMALTALIVIIGDRDLVYNKFALLWGEAQKKIAYSYPRVTYSYHKVT